MVKIYSTVWKATEDLVRRLQLSDFHFMLVDGDEVSLDMQCQMLQEFDAHTYGYSSGLLALEALPTLPPLSAILLEVAIPKRSGWEILSYIRSTPSLQDLPVIAISARALPEDRERGLAAGFDAYITKPVDYPKWIAQVVNCVVEKSLRD